MKTPAEETFAFHCDLESGAPRLATPGFVAALQLLQRLQPLRPVQPAADPPTWFRDGKAVLCLAPPLPWTKRFQAENSAVRNRFGVCRVPGSHTVFDFRTGERRTLKNVNHVPYLGAAGLVGIVPRTATKPERAFALLAYLSSPKISANVVTDPTVGGGPHRPTHTDSSNFGWNDLGLGVRTGAFVEVLRLAGDDPLVINPVLRLRIPEEHRFRQSLDVALRAALLEKKDAAQALDEAAQDWRRLIEAKGAKLHRAEYRLSVGLQP